MPATGNHEHPSPDVTHYESRITLKDGREVFLRPILPTDNDLLIDLFNRISARSIYQRFLRNLDALPEGMLHHFTHIDYRTESALVAVVEEEGKEAIVAVARYAYDSHENSTDLGLAVRDDWQNAGLGKSLLKRIVAVARENGITRFVSMIDTSNTIIEAILRNLKYEVRYSLRGGFYQVEILV